MLDPRLFRLPGFGAGSATITLAFFSMFGMFFLLTQYLQYVKGYDPLEAGLRVLPNAIALMIVAPRGPALIGRFGVRRTLRAGFFITAFGFALLATATASTSDVVVIVALLCTGTGIAMTVPGASQQIVGSLPLAKAGVGSAVNDVTREVGGALGIAVVGSVVATVFRDSDFLSVLPPGEVREVASQSIGQAVAVANEGGPAGTRQPGRGAVVHRRRRRGVQRRHAHRLRRHGRARHRRRTVPQPVDPRSPAAHAGGTDR